MITFVPRPQLLESPRRREWPRWPARPATRRSGPPRTADVVIVGGGPAAVAVVSALWHREIRDVVVLDRSDRPCRRFFDRIDLLGQRVLRSPYEHHPGVEGFRDCELLDFARLHWGLLTPVERREIRMAQAGHRSVVPVDVFEAYCEHIATSHHVTDRMWRGTVREVVPTSDDVTVRTDTAEVTARFVVLCVGEERRAAPDSWWDGDRPRTVGYWDEPVPDGIGRLVVVGAGLTAAHLVSNGLASGQRVHWVLREAREHYQCADVNATFFRPEGRARFDGVPWADRLTLMRRYRRASVMYEFRPRFAAAEADGRLTVHRGRAVTATGDRGDNGVVRLADGTAIEGDRITLAIGTVPSTGAGLLPAGLVGDRDGWPGLDDRTLAYRRAPRVFAVGAAAGMVLGPAARNVDGHRFATARVASAVATGLSEDRPAEVEVAHV